MKYSSEALERIETSIAEGRETGGMDMIPYLLSKSSLSDEQVLRVISELVFVGVDTVRLEYYPHMNASTTIKIFISSRFGKIPFQFS